MEEKKNYGNERFNQKFDKVRNLETKLSEALKENESLKFVIINTMKQIGVEKPSEMQQAIATMMNALSNRQRVFDIRNFLESGHVDVYPKHFVDDAVKELEWRMQFATEPPHIREESADDVETGTEDAETEENEKQ